jgi:hypothetical protein
MKFKIYLLIYFISIFSYRSNAQKLDVIKNVLSSIKDSNAKSVLANPETFRYQIIYTQINRDKNGVPRFTNYELKADPNQYFNPASMVKMPLAFLSLEKLHELNKTAINKNTTMLFDSSYQRQVAMYADSSSENKKPSIANFIKRAFLISENDPYNRMYQFVGQGDINRKLQQKGYGSTRITRQFMGYTEDQNRHTNGIKFVDDQNKILFEQTPQYNTDSLSLIHI